MMPVLVVQDPDCSSHDLRGAISAAGIECRSVINGAAESVAGSGWSLVVAACVSEKIGLAESLQQISQRLPQVPVVAITGQNGSDLAKDALQAGVAGCLAYDRVSTDLIRTIRTILDADIHAAEIDGPATALCHTIENDPELLPLIVEQARERLEHWPFQDQMELVRVTVALSEALDNALYHGNLELSSELRQGSGCAWRTESLRRRRELPFRDRRIRFQGVVDREAARFTVQDDGPGFDPANQRDCTESQNLERCSGRGLLLMRMYMDDVEFSPQGNSVTLVKRRPSG